MKRIRKKIQWMTVLIMTYFLSATQVKAEGGDVTIHSYDQFRNVINDIPFGKNLNNLINIAKNIGLIMLGFAFVLQMIALAIQTGKLGGTTILGPEANSQRKQEAYAGILHAVFGFAMIGIASFVFGWLFDLFL